MVEQVVLKWAWECFETFEETWQVLQFRLEGEWRNEIMNLWWFYYDGVQKCVYPIDLINWEMIKQLWMNIIKIYDECGNGQK